MEMSPSGAAAGNLSEPEGVRVRVHPGICEGWGLCRRFGGSVYSLDAEGYVDLHLLEVPPELADAARLGAGVCPAKAISILPAGQVDHG
jgi:ferredoxin